MLIEVDRSIKVLKSNRATYVQIDHSVQQVNHLIIVYL